MTIKQIFILLLMVTSLSCNLKQANNSKSTTIQPGTPQYEEEVKEIMDVIKGEFKAYYIKDYASWSNSFVHKDYLKYWGYWEGYPEKVRQYNTWNELDEDKKKRMAGEIKAYWDENMVGNDIRDLNVQIRAEVAWVTFKQKSIDQQTGEVLGESLETKILEKIDGKWKIAYQNFLFLPEENKDENK